MDEARLRRMRQGFLRLLILLGVQLLLGMVANLWVIIPKTHPGTDNSNYFGGLIKGISWALFHGALFLQLHIAVGVVLWVFATLLVVASLQTHDGTLVTASVMEWIGITGAGFNGGSFLNYGLNISSFLMSVGFVLAATSDVWGMVYSVRLKVSQEELVSHG